MDSITITLRLPDSELWPNARVHHMAKATVVKAYRMLAGAMALEEWLPLRLREPWSEVSVLYHFYWPDRRKRDKDNALSAMKAGGDGIADAGIVADDSQITYPPVIFDVDRDNPRVEVTITKLPRMANCAFCGKETPAANRDSDGNVWCGCNRDRDTDTPSGD